MPEHFVQTMDSTKKQGVKKQDLATPQSLCGILVCYKVRLEFSRSALKLNKP